MSKGKFRKVSKKRVTSKRGKRVSTKRGKRVSHKKKVMKGGNPPEPFAEQIGKVNKIILEAQAGKNETDAAKEEVDNLVKRAGIILENLENINLEKERTKVSDAVKLVQIVQEVKNKAMNAKIGAEFVSLLFTQATYIVKPVLEPVPAEATETTTAVKIAPIAEVAEELTKKLKLKKLIASVDKINTDANTTAETARVSAKGLEDKAISKFAELRVMEKMPMK